MIAETFPEAYDAVGRSTFRPDQRRRRRLTTTFPVGRYFSQPLTVECKNLEDLRTFLRKCRYVSDKEQFGQDDYWMPPEEFERSRKGDCEDFALYAWRQLLAMGYSARLTGGRHGRYGEGHAWVTFKKGDKAFLLEPQARGLGLRLPRLSTLAYTPYFSIEWDGNKAHFFQHEERKGNPSIAKIPALVFEWIYYYSRGLLFVLFAILIRLSKESALAMSSRNSKG
jgi:hypothetical protein